MRKPVAVTIGIGEHYAYAQKSAELVRKHLGLETRIITEEHLHLALDLPTFAHKVWTLKYRIWDIFPDLDFIMYHDCDWRPVRDFNIMDFLPDPNDLYYCRDRHNDHIQGLEKKYGPIFMPTKEEQEEMLQDHANQIVEQIINAMNKR